MVKLLEAYHRATQALRDGNYAIAHETFLWMFENPSLKEPASEAVRRGWGFSTWAGLGNIHAPTRARIEQIIAEKTAQSIAAPEDKHLAADLRALKQALIFAESIAQDD